MRPYRGKDKSLIRKTYTACTKLFIKQICEDVMKVWLLDLPFPTFFKLVAIYWIGLMMIFSLATPLILVVASLLPTFRLMQNHLCTPMDAAERRSLLCAVKLPRAPWLWRGPEGARAHPALLHELLTRSVLVCNSMATSLDYMHIMRQLVEEMLP